MFDNFIWQNFIAIMWPSRLQDLGEPFQPNNPAVFGRYTADLQPAWLRWKAAWELFPPDNSAPLPWNSPTVDSVCININAATDHRPQLIRVQKFGTVADELAQAFGGPLPDQTGLFTRYEVRVNRAEYDYIQQNGFYQKEKWPEGGVSFPGSSKDKLGAIEVKAAWRDMAKVPAEFRSRFFTVEAVAASPGTCTGSGAGTRCQCAPMVAGLVGFHIAHKTADFPQWVWSTFEQVDNLGEDATTPAKMQPSYFDPDFYKTFKKPRSNPADNPGASRVPAPTDFNPEPINVVRLSAIPNTPKGHGTTDTNAAYRKLTKGTVWENYVLIGTQWSTLPSFPPQTPLKGPSGTDFGCENGTMPAQGGLAFPACQVANVTMETYHQYDSCQNCHQGAQRGGADFSWILSQRVQTKPGTPKVTLLRR